MHVACALGAAPSAAGGDRESGVPVSKLLSIVITGGGSVGTPMQTTSHGLEESMAVEAARGKGGV